MDDLMKKFRRRVKCLEYELQEDENKLEIKNKFHRVLISK
jgi:hypothetical protein